MVFIGKNSFCKMQSFESYWLWKWNLELSNENIFAAVFLFRSEKFHGMLKLCDMFVYKTTRITAGTFIAEN